MRPLSRSHAHPVHLLLLMCLHHLLRAYHRLSLLKQSRVLSQLLLQLLLVLLLLHYLLWSEVAHGHCIRAGASHVLAGHTHHSCRSLPAHSSWHAASACLHTHHGSGLCHVWIRARDARGHLYRMLHMLSTAWWHARM